LAGALPNTCSPTSSLALPAGDVDGLSLAEPCLLTRFDLKATEGRYTITLLGAYADPARTLLLVHLSPDDHQLTPMANLTEDGPDTMNGGGGGGPAGAPGDYISYTSTGLQAMAGRIANLKATFRLGTQGPPGVNDPGVTIAFKLRVFTSTPLLAPHTFQLGTRQVMFRVLEATPAVIHVQVLFVGARLEDIPMGPPDPISLLDEAGKSLRPVTGGGSLESGGAALDMQWMRPAAAGTYHLNFQLPGATHSVTVNVPAMTIS
jgi:hypothetical protein